jgi:VWFA-related protein
MARIHRTTLPLLFGSLLALSTNAQEVVPEEVTFFEAVDVEVVNVEVFVTDSKGNPITGLTREDFQLQIDSEETPITNFYAQEGNSSTRLETSTDEAPQPEEPAHRVIPNEQRLHVVVFVDNLHLKPNNRQQTFKHLRRFLDQNLNPGDYVTIASQNRSLIIHNDFTDDRVVLGDVLDEVQLMATHSAHGNSTQSRLFQELGILKNAHVKGPDLASLHSGLRDQIRAYAQAEFSLATASVASFERLLGTLKGIKGRKALIHVSDGIATNPGEEIYATYAEIYGGYNYEHHIGSFGLLPHFRKLGRVANASGVTLYAIDAESDHTSAGRSIALAGGAGGTVPARTLHLLDSNPRTPLELAAQTTGGRRVQRSSQLTEDLGILARDFSSFYSLGFQTNEEGEGNHHIKIKVVNRGKKLQVRHRETFQRTSRDTKTGNFAIAALLYHAVDNPLGISLEAAERQPDAEGSEMLTIQVKIPIGKLTLLPQGATHNAQVAFFVSVKDKAGATRQVTKTPFFLKIPAERVEEAVGREAIYPLRLKVRPGDQQVVVAMRDDYANLESAVRMDLDL